MNHEESELRDDGLRETAFFTLTGAYIFGSNTLFLPGSAGGDAELREGSRWPFFATCGVWLAIFAFLALSA